MAHTRRPHRPEEPTRSARVDEATLARLDGPGAAAAPPEVQRLMHELAVHQVELEMQNEELRQAQASLEAARRRYFDLYEQAPVAYLMVGRGDRILECNRGAVELLRGSVSRMVGRSLADLLVPGQSGEFVRRQDELLGTGQVQAFELLMRRIDGTTFWAQMQINTAPQEAEVEPVSRITITDISQRKQMEDETSRLAAIVTASDEAILGQTLTGDIAAWNPAAARLFGYSPGEILGTRMSVLFPPDRMPEERTDRLQVAEGRQLAHESVRVRRDGLQFPVFVSVSPILDQHGRVTGACHIVRDITEDLANRKRLEHLLRDLRQSEQDLTEAGRRKDEFIAMLAHELRNPLAPIRNAAAILRYGPRLDPKLEWCRDVIDRQVTHMATLLDDLLDVSRITRNAISLHRQDVDLSLPIATALELTRPLMVGRGHTLTVDLPAWPVMVNGDPTRLAQVFGNLLNNAAKYTEPGGRISLTVRAGTDAVEIRISDSGVGIDPVRLGEVFGMFSQLKRSGERQAGLGIGLFLVRSLVELHHGTVAVWSEGHGRGSEFLVRLPIEPAPIEAEMAPVCRPERRTAREPRGPRQRILIVDDNYDSAESLGQILALHGCDIRTAGSGDDALEVMRVFRPDVAILDLGLPGMSGLEVGRRIREEPWGHDVLLIACTGWGQQEDQHRSREAGFDHHMVKPVDIERLLELLDSRAPAGGGLPTD